MDTPWEDSTSDYRVVTKTGDRQWAFCYYETLDEAAAACRTAIGIPVAFIQERDGDGGRVVLPVDWPEPELVA